MEESELKSRCEILLIGGSAGSLTVLFALLPTLKPDFSFPIVIVLHRKNSGDSTLSQLLAGKSKAPVMEVDDKDPILPGMIYIAPADYHLLIEKDLTFSLDDSEKVNYSRPSLDVTFESAADVYAKGVVAIILSGANEDGSRGMAAIKASGGTIVAQDPSSAQMSVMPLHAITSNDIKLILTPAEMGPFISNL